MTFPGFPRQFRSVPVPSPVFGPLLEQIDDLAEFKCTLRVIWLLHQKKGFPRFVTLNELLADRTLVKALASGSSARPDQVERALERAVGRGTFQSVIVARDDEPEKLYALNTEADRNALSAIGGGAVSAGSLPRAEPWEAATSQPNIFALYEDNIGILSPMIADELREAEELYPSSWIEEAFREAVELNKRSWRYIARILESWEREGRSDGESGRYIKKGGYY
jgi:DnaD/phage-associated family protein